MDSSTSASTSTSSRRDWLRSGAAAIGAAALAAPLLPDTLEAQSTRPPNTSRIGGLLNQLGQQAQWRSTELRLVRRITQGLTEAEVARVRALGYDAYLEEQLNPSRIDDSAMEARVQASYARMLALTPRQLSDTGPAGTHFFDHVRPRQSLTAERAIFSRRQLQERMFEFWSDHQHVLLNDQAFFATIHHERIIRPNVLGTVGDMVRAGMRSGSMLSYLDQVRSTRFGINENYARELLELHTIGVDGGFTQEDVIGLTRVLTGWSINFSTLEFEYKAGNHDFSAKSVLGLSFPARAQATAGNAGMDEGIAVGEMLIRHPSTKRYTATKLLRWFVTPTPSEAQVQAVVAAYGTEGDVKAMLRVVLSRANLTKAPAKLKRPFHYAVSTLRATGARVNPVVDVRRDYNTMSFSSADMGHDIGNWGTPDGYPDRADFWAGLIVDRWNVVNAHLVQVDNNSPGRAVIDLASFVGNGTVDAFIGNVRRRLFADEMSSELEVELRYALRSGVTNTRALNALRLAVCAPEFHFY